MATTLTVNGVAFSYPDTGDQNWGTAASGWAAAITTGTLQKAGGTFTLTADVNFGATFGLFAKYFTSVSSNPAASGVLRLANGDGIGWRNVGNSADFLLKPDADGFLQYNSIDLANISSAQTLTNKTMSGSSNTFSNIAYASLVLSNSIVNADISGSAAIAYSKLSLALSIVNGDISASAAIAFSKLATLSSANILVGSAGNVATAVAVTGDVSLSNLGVTAYSGVVPLTKGGTGTNAASANLAFAALSPLTTKGDIIGFSTVNARLGVGADGTVLTADSAQATGIKWGSVLTNPMTTLGDIIYENVSPAPARLAGNITATKNFLTQTGTGSVSAAPAWGTIALGDLPTIPNSSLSQMAANTIKGNNTGSTATAADLTQVQTRALLTKMPDVTVISNTSGNFTTPANAAWLEVEMVGAGGGGGGGGATGGTGGSPAATTFGTLSCGGGTGGQNLIGGVGGSSTIGAGWTFVVSTQGGQGAWAVGSTSVTTNSFSSGIGAASFYGGGGTNGTSGNGGGNGPCNGSGGGGGSPAGSVANSIGGGGGGAGSYLKARIVPTASQVFAYAGQNGGTGGTAGTGTGATAGGRGADSLITITIYYL